MRRQFVGYAKRRIKEIDELMMTNHTILHKRNTKRQLLKSTLADLESSAG